MSPPQHWVEDSEDRLLAEGLAGRCSRLALRGCPSRQRAVVMLRDVDGLSSEEVCEVLEISEANQRVLLHRGRSQLRASARRVRAGMRMLCARKNEMVCQEMVELVTDYLEGALPRSQPSPLRGASRRLRALHRVPGPAAGDDPAYGTDRREDLTPEMRDELAAVYRRWRSEED